MIKKNLMFLLSCLLFSAMAFAAPASVTETSITTVTVATTGPDKEWLDEDGVLHTRGLILHADVFGGAVGEEGILLGTQTAVLAFNIDLATGNGDLHGTFVRSWTVKGVSGTFSGSFQSTIMGFFFVGTVTAKGSDGFAGMVHTAVVAGVFGGGGLSSTGTILDPSGEF